MPNVFDIVLATEAKRDADIKDDALRWDSVLKRLQYRSGPNWVDALSAALAGKADDADVVHKTGAETIAGAKTFSSTPKVGADNVLTAATGVRLGADNTLTIGQFAHRNVDTGYIRISGGSAANTGANLLLYGENAASTPGEARIYANDGTTSKILIAKPDGTLTWGGQPLQTTSDERLKTAFSPVPDAVLDAWGDVGWMRFKYSADVARKGSSARWHTGLVAQRVKAAFEARGLDACEYGILCHEVWGDEYDDEGGLIRAAGEMWTVRYEEAFAMEAAYQRWRMDRIEARLAELEGDL